MLSCTYVCICAVYVNSPEWHWVAYANVSVCVYFQLMALYAIVCTAPYPQLRLDINMELRLSWNARFSVGNKATQLPTYQINFEQRTIVQVHLCLHFMHSTLTLFYFHLALESKKKNEKKGQVDPTCCIFTVSNMHFCVPWSKQWFSLRLKSEEKTTFHSSS